jgi:hypothetical protein
MKTTDFINTYAKEGVDPGEYDDEAPMIKNDLHTIVRVATHLNQALGEHENLPTWVIEKLAQTKGMLVSVMDYIISQHEMGQKEEVPGFDADQAEQMFESVLAEETLPWETDQEARKREAGGKEKSPFKKPNNPNRTPRDAVKALAQKGIPKNSDNEGVAEGIYSHDVERAFPGGKSTGVKTHSNKPAVVKTNKPIGTRVADIGPGGKEHNVKTDKEWNKQKGVAEGSQLDEFAPGQGGNGDDGMGYLHALAQAWYTHDLSRLADIARKGGSPIKKIIDAQEAVEKILSRGVHCPDGKVRKYYIDYTADFDGVDMVSHDYYEHSDYGPNDEYVDGRTGKPWSVYDHIEFSDDQLDEGVAEATGDPKFDKMLKDITGKRAVAKQQKADTKQQARDAFGSMFGSNPTKNLKIKEDASAGASGASSIAVTMQTLGEKGGFTKSDVHKKITGYSNMMSRGGEVKVKR